MPGYRLHGLALASAQALPALGSSTRIDAFDAAVILRKTPPWAARGLSPQIELLRRIDYSDGIFARSLERVTAGTDVWLVQRFDVELAIAFAGDGREVYVFGDLVHDLDCVASCISGPVASFLRWLRGWPSLHASSVVVDGRVLAVCGRSGAGKSTTVAALASRGYRVLSDEVLGWRNVAGRLLASPGPARLKLWPDALAALGMDSSPMRRVRPDLDKRFVPLPEAVQETELPLAAVYLLDRDRDARADEIQELHGAEAFAALKANCRDDSVLTPGMRARQFEALPELVRSVHVRDVRAHSGLERLNDFAGGLVKDFRRLLDDAS